MYDVQTRFEAVWFVFWCFASKMPLYLELTCHKGIFFNGSSALLTYKLSLIRRDASGLSLSISLMDQMYFKISILFMYTE